MKFLIWLACVLGVEATGMVSSYFAGDIAAKYEALNKPFLAPPGSIVGVIWIILYACIGTALYFILTSKDASTSMKQTALVWFAIQQVLNFIWSIVFFGADHFWLATWISALLVVAIVLCIVKFARNSMIAVYLFVPYLVWCLYATYLSFGLALKN